MNTSAVAASHLCQILNVRRDILEKFYIGMAIMNFVQCLVLLLILKKIDKRQDEATYSAYPEDDV